MHRTRLWFKIHRIRFCEYVQQKQPSCAPSKSWWIVLMAVEKISSVASNADSTLQGQPTLKLVATLIKLFNARYINDSEREALRADENSILSTDSRFSLNTDDIRGLLEVSSLYFRGLLLEDLRPLLLDLGHAVLKLISGIGSTSAERSSTNEAGTALPALVKLSGRDFNSVVRTYRERLLTRWSTSRVDLIEQELLSILAVFESEEAFKNALRGCNKATSFEEGWSLTGGRFSVLQEFCGGLASVFPGTTSVESDFSIVKYVKNDFWSSLTDFSLEGTLHANQFRHLLNVNTQ
ncbi:hypothetical protein PsorP6_009574 [Peronosclerospora sorghi]|uniref:Uncharacterized protein n=1 Tax=Peronosclerospora sorghi TaxID=230839 RepID=A0ACC0VZK2_9STRA|nr:hypothetical protein PsorP6_009574 [Peronosclerospora sorghi]